MYVTCGLEIYNFLNASSITDSVRHDGRRYKFRERIEYKKLNSIPRSKVIVDNTGELKLSSLPPLVAGPPAEQVESNGWMRLDLTFDFKLHPRVLLVKSIEGVILKAYHLNTVNSGLTVIPAVTIPARPTTCNGVRSKK